jgi:hypothetical protein
MSFNFDPVADSIGAVIALLLLWSLTLLPFVVLQFLPTRTAVQRAVVSIFSTARWLLVTVAGLISLWWLLSHR